MNTPQSSSDIASIADRTGFPVDAVEALARSIARGGGTMAQFSHPAFGGAGQWMRGGMLMISPSDHALKQRIAQLCETLAARVDDGEVDDHAMQSQRIGRADREASDRAPAWYPAALGVPSSSGAQNRTRYAWFAAARRLAVDDGERVTLHDTGDHVISGVSQQQGRLGTVVFTSQHGAVDVARLPVVDGHLQAEAASSPAALDPFQALERLAALHARGIVRDDEFAAKRTELIARI